MKKVNPVVCKNFKKISQTLKLLNLAIYGFKLVKILSCNSIIRNVCKF